MPEMNKTQLKKIVRLLTVGAQLLEVKGWTQDDLAKTKKGEPCGPDSAQAACFCAYGAVMRASKKLGYTGEPKIVDQAMGVMGDYHPTPGQEGGSSLVNWNDRPERMKDEVVMAFEFGALAAKSMLEGA